MRSVSPLWTRILGYGGAAVLVVAAAAVLLLQLSAGSAAPHALGSAPSPGPPGAVVVSGPSGAPGVASRQATADRTGATPAAGALGAAGAARSTRCGSVTASFQRTGDSVKVTVTVPRTGLVAAFVDAKGRGTLTKSITAEGEPSPHVFEFTGVPATITRRVGINVITEKGLQSCVLPSGS